MVGIFDSGAGGEETLSEFRKMRPDADVCFFADRENAPYGTKSRAELDYLVERGLGKIKDFGASRILIACCTASTVFDGLPSELRKISIPIIDKTAQAAILLSQGKRIGVISTEATYNSGAFVKALRGLCGCAYVLPAYSGELVSLAEAGYSDENLGSEHLDAIRRALVPLAGRDLDTVILGCTHFSRFEKTVEKILGVRTVNSARVGAMALALGRPCDIGNDRLTYNIK